MTTSGVRSGDPGAMGPVSYLIVEFPGSKMTGEGFPVLVDLVDRGLIEPGSSADILIFENRWATPLIQALRRGEAELVAAGYIPQDAIAASLDATDP